MQHRRLMVVPFLRANRRWLVWLSGAVLLVLLLIVTLPEMMRYGAVLLLERQGVGRVTIRDIDFNPFSGAFELRGLKSASGLTLDHVKLRLDWWPLWHRRLAVTEFSSNHLNLTLRERADGTLMVGGVALPATEESGGTPSAWHMMLPDAQIGDIHLTVKLAAKRSEPARTIVLSLPQLHLHDLTLSPTVVKLASLQLDDLAIDDSAHMLPESIRKIALTNLDGDPAKEMKLERADISALALPERGAARLGNIEAITLDGLQLRNAGDSPSLAAKQMLLDGITLPADKAVALGHIKAIRIEALLADAHRAAMQALTLSGLEGHVLRRKRGVILIPGVPVGDGSRKAPEAAKASTPFSLRIGTLSTSGDNQIDFRDEAVKPAATLHIDIRHFSLAPLAIGNAEKGKLAATFRLYRQAILKADGSLTPDPSHLAMNLHASLTNLGLPHLSPYVEKEAGITIHTGKLDLDTTAKVANGLLHSKNRVHIRNLQVKPGQNTVSVNGIPIDMALDMIRDDKGDIELNVPLDGPLNDLRAGIGNVVNKAMLTAMQKAALFYAAQSLYPYGAIIPAFSALKKLANAQPALTPIQFAAGSAKPNETAEAYAAKIAELLKAKQKIRLQICGVAATAEFTVSHMPNNERLLDLAQKRSSAVIHAITDHGIDPERIFACKPEIDHAENASGRVALLLK